jgi:hypothetical protein
MPDFQRGFGPVPLSGVTGNFKAPNRDRFWPEQGKIEEYEGSRETGD